MSATLPDILNSHQTHRPIVMGIINVTPDSFSDGGEFFDPSNAVAHAERLAAEGADIIDIGAESTRPGSQRVSPPEQIVRLRDILPAVTAGGTIVSIDTTSSEVAEFALDAGATIVNDVSAGQDDPKMLSLIGSNGASVVLMHMLGKPRTMQNNPHYDNVVKQVRAFLEKRIAAAVTAGVKRERIIVDPGIGFGKKLQHNLELLNGVEKLLDLGCPMLIGASRKRFIGELTGLENPKRRLAGTIAASLAAWTRGATIFRVHDVAEMFQAMKVATAVEKASKY